jgi:hypothetical protein
MLERGGRPVRCCIAPSRRPAGALLGTFEERRCEDCGDDVFLEDDSAQFIDGQRGTSRIIILCRTCGGGGE